MTTQNNEVQALKKQVFRISDELHLLYGAYEALSVIASGDGGDSSHVGRVVLGLNYRFEALLTELDKLYSVKKITRVS